MRTNHWRVLVPVGDAPAPPNHQHFLVYVIDEPPAHLTLRDGMGIEFTAAVVEDETLPGGKRFVATDLSPLAAEDFNGWLVASTMRLGQGTALRISEEELRAFNPDLFQP